jgi:hypothetical protein
MIKEHEANCGSRPVPCTHTGRGCTNADEKSMIKEHEANCGSRPVKCLDDNCGETINLDQLLNHSKQNHKLDQMDSTANMFCKGFGVDEDDFFEEYLYWINGFHALDGQSYIPLLWKKDDTFYSMLYILACKEVAEKCKVTISIYGKDASVVHTTDVVSIDTPISEAKNNKENSLPLNIFLAKKCISKNPMGENVLFFEYKVLKS